MPVAASARRRVGAAGASSGWRIMSAFSPRRILHVAIGLAVIVIAAFILHSLSRPKLPSRNLLLVTLDTTRADRLSCYGYDRETSPRIDAFARDATLFDLAIAQAA